VPKDVHEDLLNDQHGSVSIIFAVALVVILVVSGAAIDLVRQHSVQSQLQAAVDAAALSAASNSGSDTERQTAAKAAFAANSAGINDVTLDPVAVSVAGGTISVKATGALKTSFMSLAGINAIPLNALAESATSDSADMEVALVVDVSGSMGNFMGSKDRIEVLKDSAQNLLDTLSSNGSDMSHVKVGVVPFNMNVNLGASYSSYVTGLSNPLFSSQAWAGCVMERAWPESNSDTYDGGTGPTGKFYAYAAPPEPDQGSTGSCLNPGNGSNAGYQVVDPPSGFSVQTRGPNYNCVRHPIMPLSANYADIKNKISELTAESNMGTIIAPGIAWGLRLLSPAEPFAEGKPYGKNTHKFLVVLTDGELTTEGSYNVQFGCDSHVNSSTTYSFDPASTGQLGKSTGPSGPKDAFSGYGYILDSDPFGSGTSSWDSVSDDLEMVSLDACKKVKQASGDSPIEVFTIAVSDGAGPGTRVYNLLQNCATDTSHFFYANDATAMQAAFSSITKKISDVRLTR
jgi:Flp pilus assembly protein TadG